DSNKPGPSVRWTRIAQAMTASADGVVMRDMELMPGNYFARTHSSADVESLSDSPCQSSEGGNQERVWNFVCGASMRRPHDTQSKEADLSGSRPSLTRFWTNSAPPWGCRWRTSTRRRAG